MNIKKMKLKYRLKLRKIKKVLSEVNWACKLDKKN